MTTIAWRIVPLEFSEPPFDPFDGEGARLYGGRWNSVGNSIVYTSATRSLAILEKLVHAEGKLASLLDCAAFPVIIPNECIRTFPRASLATDWNLPGSSNARQFGDAWVRKNESPVLKVPSAVVTEEENYLLNPLHPDFSRLKLGERQTLPIDSRLLIPRKPII